MYNNKDICVVTSFSKKCYSTYASKFLNSYCLPFDLFVYSEDNLSDIINSYKKNIKYENIFDDKEFKNFIISDGPKEFDSKRKLEKCNSNCESFCFEHVNRLCKKKCGNRSINCGGKCENCIGGYENVWKETKKFSYKVFSIINSIDKYKDKYKIFIWFDADIIFKKEFDVSLLRSIIEKKKFFIGYLGRWMTYLEAGFLIFNSRHKLTSKFFDYLRNLYLSKDIYYEQQIHDAYIWNLVMIRFKKKYGKRFINVDITDNWAEKNKRKGNKNILMMTKFSNYIYHDKGRNKHNNS